MAVLLGLNRSKLGMRMREKYLSHTQVQVQEHAQDTILSLHFCIYAGSDIIVETIKLRIEIAAASIYDFVCFPRHYHKFVFGIVIYQLQVM